MISVFLSLQLSALLSKIYITISTMGVTRSTIHRDSVDMEIKPPVLRLSPETTPQSVRRSAFGVGVFKSSSERAVLQMVMYCRA